MIPDCNCSSLNVPDSIVTGSNVVGNTFQIVADVAGTPFTANLAGNVAGTDSSTVVDFAQTGGKSMSNELNDQLGVHGSRQLTEPFNKEYATVHASVRGPGCSGGEFDLFSWRSALDGYEIVEWINERLLREGLISPDDERLLFVTDDQDAAVDRDRAGVGRRQAERHGGEEVGRRLLALFVGCAFVPMAVLAALSYRHVKHQLYRQSENRLQQANLALNQAIFDRLLLLDATLKSIPPQVILQLQASKRRPAPVPARPGSPPGR